MLVNRDNVQRGTVGNPVNIARVTEIEAETESRRNHVVSKA